MIQGNGEVIAEGSQVANVLNNYFASVFTQESFDNILEPLEKV